jgi:hypothetical protein
MTPESRNSEIRDVHCQATVQYTHSRGNEYASSNRVTSVAMQRRCKHAFATLEEVAFSVGPPRGYIRDSHTARIRIGSSSEDGSRR